MSIALIQNERDNDMIEVCGKKGEEWPFLLAVAHWDTIVEAAEGDLLCELNFTRPVECVLVYRSEWRQICADLVEANEKIDRLERDLEQAQL